MTGAKDYSRLTLHPAVRGGILFAALTILVAICWFTTGKFLPSDANDVLLVQNSLLLVVLGTLISERYFTGPGDAFLNALTALLTVLPLHATAPRRPWWGLIGFLFCVFLVALVTLLLQGGRSDRVRRPTLVRLQRIGFQITSALGRARIVYSVVFLAAVIFFVKKPGPLTTSLLLFWGIYLSLWPLAIPQLLSKLIRRQPADYASLGNLVRVDSPNLARVLLLPDFRWSGNEDPVVISWADGTRRWGLPLMSENTTDGVLGTVLLGAEASGDAGKPGTVCGPDDPSGEFGRSEFVREVSDDKGTEILGLVRESSRSARLRFELLPSSSVTLGQLVVVREASGWIYYQVVEGETAEEQFGTLNYGSQIATAVPVGLLDSHGTFIRAGWMPKINAPVFGIDPHLKVAVPIGDDFLLGHIPGTSLELRGDFVQALESHTAILGATGSGKTELAFDLVRHAVTKGVKVICIDLTSQYAPRLADLDPIQLTISDDKAADLGNKLFDVETGQYGAGNEKKVLQAFSAALRAEVDRSLRDFLTEPTKSTALIELREIANTKATLWITEMYLSTLLKLAKDNATDGKVLVVIEEAHTVMPESSFAGLGDFDSKGTIAKISQLALQGRKYGVGLLVLAQRTATVSKSVLTQCNTIVSFACIDDTSINFLRHVYGSAVAEGLPSLRKLRAIASGEWVKSDLPIMFDVPFDQEKADRIGWSRQSRSPGTPIAADD